MRSRSDRIPGPLYRTGAGTPTFVTCAVRPADPPP
jgi:hypothetical protein